MKGEFRVKTLHFVLTGEQLIVNLKPTVENGSLAFIKLILILIRWNSHDFIDFDILQICFSSVLSDNRFSMTTPVQVRSHLNYRPSRVQIGKLKYPHDHVTKKMFNSNSRRPIVQMRPYL